MRLLKQSTTYNLVVFMTDSSDHVTGKTGLTLTITASKDGAAFSSITPTVTELSNGWYKLALTTSHTDTVGDLALHITATGADPTDLVMQVRAYVMGDTLPANVLQFGSSNGTFSSGRPEVNTTHAAGTAWGSGAITASSIAASALNGKGDWNIGKTGYSLTQSFPTNFASLAITVGGAVTAGTVSDKTGYSLTQSFPTNFASLAINASGHVILQDGSLVTAKLGTFALAKTTNITGFNDIAATAIVSGGAITTSSGAVSTVTTVTNQLTAAQIATGVWQDSTAGDFTAASSIGKSLYTSGNTPGAASGLALVGSNMGTVSSVTGSVGSVTGAVGSVTGNVGGNVVGSVGSISGVSFPTNFSTLSISVFGAVTVGTNSDKTGYFISGMKTTLDDLNDLDAAGVWDEALSGHTTAGTTGKALSDAGSAGDPWSTSLPGFYTSGQAGYILGTYLDAAISSRSSLDAAGVRSAVGLASANLDDQLDALPTSAEITSDVGTALSFSHGAGSWATATGFSTLTEANVRSAVGLASANLDTQLSGLSTGIADVPTTAEFEARTIAAASYAQIGSEMNLADNAITSAKVSVGSISGAPSGFLERLTQLWNRFLGRTEKDDSAGTIKTYDALDNLLTTQTISSTATTQSQGRAS